MKNQLITIEEQLVIMGGLESTTTPRKIAIVASKTTTKTTTTLTFTFSW